MHRKLSASKTSMPAALKPLMTRAFGAPSGIPNAMRAVLAQLQASESGGDRRATDYARAIRILTDDGTRDVETAKPTEP